MSVHALVNTDPSLHEAPPQGAILARAYRVEGRLGAGGMGIVLRATEIASQCPVAIKVMTASAAADPEQVARFRREAKVASSLTSKHVVRVLDAGDLDSGVPFLVMEHLEGSTLAELARERGPLPVGEAVGYILQAIHGVSEAHALGIVHRDLKPANLFVSGGPEARTVKVLDFGAAKLTSDSTFDPGDPGGVTMASSLIGSPRYMAPEQIRTALDVDARADVYALGASLHELLSGKPIFFADSLAAIFGMVLWEAPEPIAAVRDDVPPELVAVLAQCLAKAPADRFASAAALAVALTPFAAPHPSEPPGAPRSPASGFAPVAPKVDPPRLRPPPPRRLPAPAAGSSLLSSRLFKAEEAVAPSAARAPGDRPLAARPAVPRMQAKLQLRARDVEGPPPAGVLARSTQRMPRVKTGSPAPKRTVKMAAFALAAHLAPSQATDAKQGAWPRWLIVLVALAALAVVAAASAGLVLTRGRHVRSAPAPATPRATPAAQPAPPAHGAR